MAKRVSGGGQWTAEYAQRLLERCEQSGQSLPVYAQSLGVRAQRLYWWRHRLAETARARARSLLVPVSVRSDPWVTAGEGCQASAPAVVVERGGVRLEVYDVAAVSAAWVASVLSGVSES